jgi:type I restriction enzyme M protein
MFEQAFKNIDDVLWKEAGCTTELDYTEQSWIKPNCRTCWS